MRRSRRAVMVVVSMVALSAFAAGFATAEVGAGRWPSRLHWPLDTLNWVPLPEFGGAEAIIYRSSDGKRVYAAFKESGHESFKYPFDEFGYVISGSANIKVKDGPAFTLHAGDTFVFREGMEVDLDFGPGFADLTVLTADHAVKWR